jgi:hypothetical protein
MTGIILCRLSYGVLVEIDIQISSFSARIESGVCKYIQAVIPGLDHASEIADMADGSMAIIMVTDESETVICTLPITSIRIDEGANKQSITLQANA